MTIETSHLRLRPFTLDDTTFIVELLNSKGWLEFIGDRHVRSIDEAATYLVNGPLKSYADNGFGLSMVELKTDGSAVGMCGLIKREGLDDIDLGFAFLPQHSGKGYATEISKAVLNHAFVQLCIPKVVAITVPENTGSIKVLKKTGMVETGRVTLPNETKELLQFSISNPRIAKTFPPEFIALNGPRLTLRDIVPAEAGNLLEIFTWSSVPAKTPEEVADRLKKTAAVFHNKLGINWGIELRESRQIIGTMGYYRGFPENCGEVGFVLKTAYRRQGFAEEALRLVLKFGYDQLHLDKITAWTKADNIACQKLLLKCDFEALDKVENGYCGYVHRASSPV